MTRPKPPRAVWVVSDGDCVFAAFSARKRANDWRAAYSWTRHAGIYRYALATPKPRKRKATK